MVCLVSDLAKPDRERKWVGVMGSIRGGVQQTLKMPLFVLHHLTENHVLLPIVCVYMCVRKREIKKQRERENQ